MEINANLPKFCSKFYCQKCDYGTCKKSSYDDHLLSNKHIKSMISNEILPKICSNFICQNCNRKYKDNSGLWRHKKKCTVNESEPDELNEQQNESVDLIKYLMKENSEFKQMIIEQNKQMIEISKNNSITNNGNINSNNKTFNLQVFLNETCKDAMNIMDFVNSLKIELSDLENVGNVGYVNGISSIIVKNLNLLDETKRPVHCADTKREVMYVKDDNKWEKDNENKSQMRKIIKHATHKNSKLLKEYKAKYPGCEKSESKYSYAYDKLIVETFGGKGDDEIGKENKIIRNIAKNVAIDKKY